MHSVIMLFLFCFLFIVLIVPMNGIPVKYGRASEKIWIDNEFLDLYRYGRTLSIVDGNFKITSTVHNFVTSASTQLNIQDEPVTITDLYVELGELFEGDIVLTPSQKKAIRDSELIRNGLISITSRWPNNTVVYHIVKEDFDENQLKMIEEGMNDIANKSCIKFRESENKEKQFVRIQGSDDGCYSNVGFISNKEDKDDGEEESEQVLNLSKGCFRHGTIVHEMLHTLGFYHMQSTYDRDDFVKIIWENIKSGKENNFEKYTLDTVTDFGVPYDYTSVMHYPDRAFSKNGEKTIIPVKENVTIGQRCGLSEHDILKLNRMYCE